MSVANPAKIRKLLIVSVALNIFFAAFLLGRCGLMHPHGDYGPGAPGGMHGEMKPPPFFRPEDLFTPEEMKQNFAMISANFDAIDTLRKGFADQLDKGSVTKDEVFAHFAEVDHIREATKKQLQEKAAAKIASLTPQERATFAAKMREERRPQPPAESEKPHDKLPLQ